MNPASDEGLVVVHATNAFCADGTGHTMSTFDLATRQASLGHRVVVVCGATDQVMRDTLARFGVTVVDDAPFAGWRSLFGESRRRYRTVLAPADVIHVHTVKSMALALVASPWRFLGSSVSTVHNPHQRSSWLMYLTRRVVALSRTQAEQIQRRTVGLVRPTVIHNGSIGSPRMAALRVDGEQVDLPPNSVVFVGALHPRKGLDVLLRSMRRVVAAVPDAHLYVVGNRDHPGMEQLAADLGLADAVTFTGYARDPRAWMRAASVFVLPSREEGFGNVITEARSCRVPIVASDVGGVPEALSDGEAGLLVPPQDPGALADAIVSVLTDAELAADLRRRTQRGLDEMTVERAAREYDAVYSTLRVRSRSPEQRDEVA